MQHYIYNVKDLEINLYTNGKVNFKIDRLGRIHITVRCRKHGVEGAGYEEPTSNNNNNQRS